MRHSALALLAGAYGSLHAVKKCAGHTCDQSMFPFLDWDPPSNGCTCRAHPCHADDKGPGERTIHKCTDKKFPHLTFRYDEKKMLVCKCSQFEHFASVFVAKDLCAGHLCKDAAFPLLDYDEKNQSCLCRSHPCHHDGNGTLRHECNTADFPVLRYRFDEKDKLVCECIKQPVMPNTNKEL